MSEKSLIHSLIPKVMSEVGAIGKNKLAQGYKFRGIDDVYLALQKPLYTHGVYFVPEVLENIREEKQSKHGSTLIIAIMKVKYTFYGPDGSSVSATTIGEAMDVSDKASNKAMSAALKYALFQVFCIPTEEDKDSEIDSHELLGRQAGHDPQEGHHNPNVPPKPQVNTMPSQNTAGYNARSKAKEALPVTEPQLARLRAIASKNNWLDADIKLYIAQLGLKSTKELNRIMYDDLINKIEKFPKQRQQAEQH